MRKGLNCTLSYLNYEEKELRYRVRARRLTKGYTMIAEESQARTSKAFYPRQTAPTQFGIQIDLIGARERNSFNRYLMDYATLMLRERGTQGQESIQMTVQIPSRNFVRMGIPMSGIEFGTVVGEMVFSPVLVFETSREPLDWNAQVETSIVQDDLSGLTDDATQYFYPTGIQLSGEDQAASVVAATNTLADDILGFFGLDSDDFGGG